ncbi:uncharacterized protein LOC127870776 [Dreissena polymorpha]|uniref:Uncharacterized protein n=1 Tax=Dreissena polymorpha TaxID=45954 RepID=A0A9D4L9E9_DREPO|nr:uncharacterized protein LOC127870776 [Dreissena polymorpha]KAH3854435.1 hypothetical protein DPMN_096977 [Dreissena polymorpha]
MVTICKIGLQLGLAVTLVVLSLIVLLVSLVAPYWNQSPEGEHWGLWQRCVPETGCEAIDGEPMSGVMQLGRVCVMLCVVGLITVLSLLAVYVCCRRDVRIISASIALCFLSMCLTLLSAFLWGSAGNTSLSWCYFLCYLCGLGAAGAGGVLIYVRRMETFKQMENGGSVV